jgi:hypothetical protein
MTKKKPLKVGFDLDGVILYNPARIVRPILALFRKVFLHKKKTAFYIPRTRWEKLFWLLVHKSSLFVAPGVSRLQELIKEGKIEAYIITGRYDSLKTDFDKWMEKIEAEKYFKAYIHNAKEEQPFVFKKRMINKFQLDVFVEDNWDIIQLLNNDHQLSTKIFWINNALDKGLDYKYKFPNLSRAVEFLEKSQG